MMSSEEKNVGRAKWETSMPKRRIKTRWRLPCSSFPEDAPAHRKKKKRRRERERDEESGGRSI